MRKMKIIRSALVLVMTAALALGLGTVAFAAVSFGDFGATSSAAISDVVLKSRDNESLEVHLASLEALQPLWASYSGADIAKSVALDRAINDNRCERSDKDGVSTFLTNSPTIVVVPNVVKLNSYGELEMYGVALDVPDGTEVKIQYGLLDSDNNMLQPKTLPGKHLVENGVLLITLGKDFTRQLNKNDSFGLILTYTEGDTLNVFMSSHVYGSGTEAQKEELNRGYGYGYGGGGRGRSSEATPQPTMRPSRFGVDFITGNNVIGLETTEFNWWNFGTSDEVMPVIRQIAGDGTQYINIYGGPVEIRFPTDGGEPQLYLNLNGETTLLFSDKTLMSAAGYLEPISDAIKSGINVVDKIGGMIGVGKIASDAKNLLDGFFH